MNEETERRIWKQVIAKLLDDICKTYSYCIFTKCIYNPVDFKSYCTIKVTNKAMNRSGFRTATVTFPVLSSDHMSGNDYFSTPNGVTIYYEVDEWDYILALYVCALICQDEATINDIEVAFNNFGIEMRTNDILKDIDDLITQYTSPDLANGELVAWLLEFKRRHFGFDGSHEPLVL